MGYKFNYSQKTQADISIQNIHGFWPKISSKIKKKITANDTIKFPFLDETLSELERKVFGKLALALA